MPMTRDCSTIVSCACAATSPISVFSVFSDTRYINNIIFYLWIVCAEVACGSATDGNPTYMI